VPVLNSRFVEGAALGILARAYAGTLDGLFTALLDVFTHLRKAPLRRPEDFRYVYEKVRLFAHRKLNNDVFRPNSFASLVAAAATAATQRFARHRPTLD